MIRLLLVTLLLAGVALAVKLRSRSAAPARAIRVTSRLGVSRGAIVAVVEVDGRRLLIGAAPNQINLLAEQEMTKALEMLQALCKANGIRGPGEDGALREMIAKTHVEQVALELERQVVEGKAGG